MKLHAKPWVRFTVRVAAAAVVGLVVAGMVYEKIGERQDRVRYPQIGRSVDVGGRSLNIYCSGKGDPAVVFEAPGPTAGYTWIDIQTEIAKFTRACWYDRAGYGWSDPGPSPRTFDAIAKDLHVLLQAAAVPAPYVLVGGAGNGSFHVRVYNGLYPSEVAGVVLVDASDPDVFAHELKYMKGALSSLPPWARRAGCAVVFPAMVRVGLLRLLGNPGVGRPVGLAELHQGQQQELYFLSTNPSISLTEGEACREEESVAEVRAAGDFGTRPLVVLEGAEPEHAPSPEYEKATEAFNDYWFHQLLPRLAALSTRGRLVLAADATAPETVVAAVRNVVTKVRAEQQK
ncbi:MAG: alpha/beta hydrolase [Terriglobia bacterium]|jgi:pimeloyl-ACP methyl ester carboxylesterase